MTSSSTQVEPPDCFSIGESSTEKSQTESGHLVEAAAPPVRQTSIALNVLAALAVLFAIYFARAIVMPVVFAVVLALLLRPIVRKLRKYRLPDYVSGGGLLLTMMFFVGLGGMYLTAPAQEWIENAPKNLRSAGEKLKIVTEQIDKISETSDQMGDIANGDSGAEERSDKVLTVDGIKPSKEIQKESEKGGTDGALKEKLLPQSGNSASEDPVPVEVKQPRFQTGLALFSTTGNVLSQIFITLVLAYFLLAWGDVLLNNVLHTLSTFREKRCTVELVHSVEEGVSAYLLTVTCINIGLGVAIGTAMWLFGMPNPVLWGVMATLFNFVPYLGALAGIVIVFVVAVLTFDSFSYSILIPLCYFFLTTIEGNFVTPYLLGRSMSLNPILIILSLIFWSWMWGVGGAILAVPLLAILKVAFDQFERTRAFGMLLSGSE